MAPERGFREDDSPLPAVSVAPVAIAARCARAAAGFLRKAMETLSVRPSISAVFILIQALYFVYGRPVLKSPCDPMG